ncbi:MAG: aminotransferase class IV [Acidobacteria bacterium]|nr:aminotransferase class IV [Acidobacteriota bacterium]
MRNVFWQDRIVSDAKEAKLDAFSLAAFYGQSVFTTVAVRDCLPLLQDKHWRRLSSNAALLGIDISAYSEERVFTALAELAEANSDRNGVSRITFFDMTTGGLWTAGSKTTGTALLITTRESRKTLDVFTLTTSPFLLNSTSPLAGVKSGNYLENLTAFNEAEKRGFDEAVRINERGEVVGGCLCNIFWTSDGLLYTPRLNTGCLPGTTREFVMETFECAEVSAAISDLENADEIFLTSAGIGVVQVSDFNGRALSAKDHDITSLL